MSQKKSKTKYEPVEKLPSTWEGVCSIVIEELRMIRKTLKQIKGIVAEIKDKKK